MEHVANPITQTSTTRLAYAILQAVADRPGISTVELAKAIPAGTGRHALILQQFRRLAIVDIRIRGRGHDWYPTPEGTQIAQRPIEALAKVWGGDLRIPQRRRPRRRTTINTPWPQRLLRQLWTVCALEAYRQPA